MRVLFILEYSLFFFVNVSYAIRKLVVMSPLEVHHKRMTYLHRSFIFPLFLAPEKCFRKARKKLGREREGDNAGLFRDYYV